MKSSKTRRGRARCGYERRREEGSGMEESRSKSRSRSRSRRRRNRSRSRRSNLYHLTNVKYAEAKLSMNACLFLLVKRMYRYDRWVEDFPCTSWSKIAHPR